ncbi:Niemann-Pick C1 protein [Eurytemora carolleeae]|uniref:Niemann-Pick C1 protein n=1 Tax=Eurytemora carolleeae TaxID=1294199 RepID=UPI000C755DAF|nr:Niemann-Pick C1 protein [Eurytemora carolleeae]|eukprot:XP_023320290.1 Niemann-Pick C1 protein-like [Eurytemora affinis]
MTSKTMPVKKTRLLFLQVDAETEEFESALATLLLNTRDIVSKEFKVEVNVASSFAQIASSTILGDVTNFVVGFFIVFIYVNIMLGRLNFVEQRMFLSLMGLMSVGISIFFSYGVCSLMGLQFGPLHNIIPFLILGIGIDDMFVTTQCFSNLPKDGKERSLHERMGCAMKNAGCAITITSITDFIAFIIGGTTVLPALRSFCIFCAIGILAVYFLQATWFIAWFSLDQRRIEEKRNGSIPCYVHVNYTPNKLSQQNIVATMFQHLADIILRKPAKIMLLFLTAALFGISIYGNVELRQEFNPIWFLPSDSYIAQWHHFNSIYYPSRGEQVTVFIGNLDLPRELVNLEHMHSELLEQKDIIAEIDSWYLGFKNYMETNFLNGKSLFELEKDEFDRRLTQYLFSPGGSQHRFLFQFNHHLACGEPSPTPQLSILSFKHRLMSGPEEQIPAMNRVKTIIRNSNFSSRVFPMAQGYASWETDEVISVELYRNMSLALGCIFITTWILLFNFWACIMVLISVVVTLVNVAGFMHFWGLTIDTVSCTNLIIAIGLCVDYSAHITHTFMVNTGSRERRVKDALINIGPAVLNGGFSTFLAFILLATSKSHVFTSFFKIFFLVVLFGLYNGLILLPLLLSIFGPRSYNHDVSSTNTSDEIEPLKPMIKQSVVQKENQSSETQVERSNSKP